jgi:hypothetical protein
LDTEAFVPCCEKLSPYSFFKTSNVLNEFLFTISVESIVEMELASSRVFEGVRVAVITTSVSL